MSYVEFSGETPWDAIVNHNSLDIEEEQAFLDYCATRAANEQSDEWTLRRLYAEFSDAATPSLPLPPESHDHD